AGSSPVLSPRSTPALLFPCLSFTVLLSARSSASLRSCRHELSIISRIAVWRCVLGDKLEQLARLRRNSSLFDGVSLSALARYRLCYLALYASAALFRVDPGRNGVKFTCKGGKRAGRAPNRCVSRESDEE